MRRFICVDTHVGLGGPFGVIAPGARSCRQVITGGNVEKLHSRFAITRWLNPADSDLYYGILELATSSEETVVPWGPLRATGEFEVARCRVVRCSWRELAIAAGFADFGKSTAEQLRAGLLRLARVRQTLYERNVELGGTQWLAWRYSKKHAVIVLNPRATSVLGMSRTEMAKHPVTFLSLEERAALPDGESRAMHAWLSAWARPKAGRECRISLRKLAAHIWKDDPGGTTSARRRARFVGMLQRFDGLGGRWRLTVSEGMVHVQCETLQVSPEKRLGEAKSLTSDKDWATESTFEASPQGSAAPTIVNEACAQASTS